MASDAPAAHPETRPGRLPPPLAVGTVVWLASELMFFGGLFAAYFTLRAGTDVGGWPPEGVDLETARTALATAVLVLSSVTLHFAVPAIATPAGRKWLALTVFLGTVFLANQAWEYAEAPFSLGSHAYGSIFYLMTGFHGLHVLGGLAFMGFALALVSGPGAKAPPRSSFEVCAYYWHFVDAVWVAMFVTVYLLK